MTVTVTERVRTPSSLAVKVNVTSVDSVTDGAIHVVVSAVGVPRVPPISEVHLCVTASPSGSLTVPVRLTVSPTSTVVWSADQP